MGSKFKTDWNKFKEDYVAKEEEVKNSGYKKDEREWKPKLNDKKEATVIFRFIPDANGQPFVKYVEHSFDYFVGTEKKKYWKPCINTFGYDKACPICKKVSEYYKSDFEKDKAIGKAQSRKIKYVSNIYIEKNANDPETEGKVFYYKYGKKIWEKIEGKMFPKESAYEDPDFVAFTPFDVYEGARFKLIVKPQGDYPNYDDSSFSPQSPFLNGDDDKIEVVINQTTDLSEFTDPKKFPTNEDVIKEIGFLYGLAASPHKEEVPKENIPTPDPKNDDIPFFDSPTPSSEPTSSEDDDDDFFNNL